jgi:hypothetical protein
MLELAGWVAALCWVTGTASFYTEELTCGGTQTICINTVFPFLWVTQASKYLFSV